MVPTMSEYFGQWKVSRFVAGDLASSESFNVVSRLSDIRDILTGLEVVYEGVEPAIGRIDEAKAAQTGRELTDLRDFNRAALRAGAGRKALHARAGRDARNRGAGARDGDRRTGLAGGGGARCRDRAVAWGRARSPRELVALALVARAGAQPARPAWRLAADLRMHLADAERALIVGRRAKPRARAARRRRACRVWQSSSGRRELEIGTARSTAQSSDGDEVKLAAARAALHTAVLGAAYRKVVDEPRACQACRREALAARPRVPASDSLLPSRRGRDARGRLGRRGSGVAKGGT